MATVTAETTGTGQSYGQVSATAECSTAVMAPVTATAVTVISGFGLSLQLSATAQVLFVIQLHILLLTYSTSRVNYTTASAV